MKIKKKLQKIFKIFFQKIFFLIYGKVLFEKNYNFLKDNILNRKDKVVVDNCEYYCFTISIFFFKPTSVCSVKHLPGYVKAYDQYKAKGIDHIICISVNDPFVMDAWGKSHNVGNKILMAGDPFLNFTKSIGADVDKSTRGLGVRSNRYAILIDNLKVIKLQEEKDTGSCEISAAENFLKLV